jgi:hypothetical protein
MQHDLERQRLIGEGLRALPEEPAPYDWREFQRRGQERIRSGQGHTAHRRTGILMMAAGAAAGLIVAIVGLVLVNGFKSQGDPPLAQQPAKAPHRASSSGLPEPSRFESASYSDPGAPRQPPGHEPAAAAEVQDAVLEGWLASLPDPALVRVGSRAAAAGLEDRIAQLDDEISAERVLRARSAHVDVIQQQRALLVRSLAQVRYAESLAAPLR